MPELPLNDSARVQCLVFMGILPLMKRSMKDGPRGILTSISEATSNHTRVRESPKETRRRFNLSRASCYFVMVRRERRPLRFMQLVYSRRSSLIGLVSFQPLCQGDR